MTQEDKAAEARRKNREAQQRFRERQRAAVREAEEQYQAVSAGVVVWAWLGTWLGMAGHGGVGLGGFLHLEAWLPRATSALPLPLASTVFPCIYGLACLLHEPELPCLKAPCLPCLPCLPLVYADGGRGGSAAHRERRAGAEVGPDGSAWDCASG